MGGIVGVIGGGEGTDAWRSVADSPRGEFAASSLTPWWVRWVSGAADGVRPTSRLELILPRWVGSTLLDPGLAKSSVMMSQKRSDPFAMFNKINVKADRGRSTASGISQGNKLILTVYQAWVGAGGRLGWVRIRSSKHRGRQQSNSVERQSRIIHRISIRINAQKCQTGLNKTSRRTVVWVWVNILGIMGSTWRC